MASPRILRLSLLLFIGVLLFVIWFDRSDRAELGRAVVVERVDPAAVIQTRQSQIVQADLDGEKFSVNADQHLTYSDGTLRMIDGVEITVKERQDRTGFVLIGNEASISENRTKVEIDGSVQMIADDGLKASSEHAIYVDAEGIVQMPSETRLARSGMDALGAKAEYHQDENLVKLFDRAEIDLHADGVTTRIVSGGATLTQLNGQMNFFDGVIVGASGQSMTSEWANAQLDNNQSSLNVLELGGGAYIKNTNIQGSQFREMSANSILLQYGKTSHQIETASLTGQVVIQLNGSENLSGARIMGQSIDIDYTSDGAELAEVFVREAAVLELPQEIDQPFLRIGSNELRIMSKNGSGLNHALFNGAIKYVEGADSVNVPRTIRADQLEARLLNRFSTFKEARFRGNVIIVDSDDVSGEADEALYNVKEGVAELITVGPEGKTPRIVDKRSWIQGEELKLVLDSGMINASGNVESVLTSKVSDFPSSEQPKRPNLLNSDKGVLVTSENFSWISETSIATYKGDAHVWQEEFDLYGDEIILDERIGSIHSIGNVRTRLLVNQLQHDSGIKEEEVVLGSAKSIDYLNDKGILTYTSNAILNGPLGLLNSDKIELHLQSDGRTLKLLKAFGNVVLKTPDRIISGASLVYYDSEGRYEMRGKPVILLEKAQEDKGDETEVIPSTVENKCRETTGRALTFFVSSHEILIDGQSEVRARTASSECSGLIEE